jgi:hypothetical protein
MRRLSISRAWEETRDILSRDGRLFVSVALALLVLPSLVTGLVNPKGMGAETPLWGTLLALMAFMITLAGQLGLVRLALGPSITVGQAIAHGMRRMPVYVGGVFIVILILVIAAAPFAVALRAMGVPLPARGVSAPAHPATLIFALLYFVLMCFAGVRMMLSAPVASAESIGPIALIKRSWQLTAGHFWQLFGFLVLFFIATVVVLIGVGAAIGVVTALLFGPVRPMSVGALVVALVQALLSATLTTLLAVMLARIYVQLSGRAEADSGVPITGS